MSTEAYHDAIDLIHGSDLKLLPAVPLSPEQMGTLEARLGHGLPQSYKLMLAEFGRLTFGPTEIYGIGGDGLDSTFLQNILTYATKEREEGRLGPTMVRIMASGYGPYFVLDCAQMDAAGECPVFELTLAGVEGEKTRTADSFGDFLLAEVKMVLDRRRA